MHAAGSTPLPSLSSEGAPPAAAVVASPHGVPGQQYRIHRSHGPARLQPAHPSPVASAAVSVPHLSVPPAAVLPSPAGARILPSPPAPPPPPIISSTPSAHASFQLPPTAPGNLGRADQEIEGLRRALAADPIVGAGSGPGQDCGQLAEVWRLQQELFLRQAEPLADPRGVQEFDMYSRRSRDRKRRPVAHGEASVEGLMQTLQQLGDSIDEVMGDPSKQPKQPPRR